MPFQKGHKGFLPPGGKQTKEHIAKRAVALRGRKVGESTRAKLREAFRGSKSPLWKGGVSREIYPSGWTNSLRESIRERDEYICQECGLHQDELTGRFKKHDIHHIDYNKDNLDPNNLLTLCRSCHIQTNGSRHYWYNKFKKDNYVRRAKTKRFNQL